MALINQFDLAHLPAFINRVQIAILKTAIDVQAEDEANLTPPPGFARAAETADEAKQRLHELRSALAYKVLHGPTGYAALFAQAVATNAAVTEQSVDGDIEFTVNSMWDAFAIGAA